MENSSLKADFPTEVTLEKRLAEFLEERGLTPENVLAETDQGFGRPALAVACGSVLAGFGNGRSDLDLLVIVENDKLTRFPVQSHEHGTLIDVNIRRASAVREQATRLRDTSWPRFESVTQEAWSHRRRALKTTTRLALGLPLTVTEPWGSWYDDLRELWLVHVVQQWWSVEARRLGFAARLLLEHRPMTAAVRAREAVVAALNARAAAAGQVYFSEKWVGEKLRTADDQEGLAILREVLTPPLVPSDRVAHCLDLVDRLTGPVLPLHAVLRWATGVGTVRLGDRTVVDRWQLRALEVSRTDLPPAGSEDILWSGPLDSSPPPEVHKLFTHDMLWLGAATRDEEVSA